MKPTVVLGNICKSLAALGNESDADLPAAALLDAGSRLDACGINFIGSALLPRAGNFKSCAVGSLAAVESLVVGLRIVVGKQGLCDARDSRTAGDTVDLRSCSLDSLDRDLAGVALHSRSVLVEERNDLSLAAVDGSLYLRCGLVALLAALRTALLTLWPPRCRPRRVRLPCCRQRCSLPRCSPRRPSGCPERLRSRPASSQPLCLCCHLLLLHAANANIIASASRIAIILFIVCLLSSFGRASSAMLRFKFTLCLFVCQENKLYFIFP